MAEEMWVGRLDGLATAAAATTTTAGKLLQLITKGTSKAISSGYKQLISDGD